MIDYEYRVLTFPRATSGSDVWRALIDHAEYGQWELTRSVTYFGGIRRAWLRRKIIRVRRTA